MSAQAPAEAMPLAEQSAPGLAARIGGAIRSGYEAVADRIDAMKDTAYTLAAIGGIAFVGAQAAELTLNPEPVAAEGDVPALTGALTLPGAPGTEALATASDTTTSSDLEQECVQAALKEPKIVKDGIRHAGKSNQLIFLTAQYDALPAGCQTDYHRGNTAKAQFFHNGRWINPSEHGWLGLGGSYDDQGNYIIDPPTAFTGKYIATAGIHDPPWYLDPCRVRILLKENVTHPTQNSNSSSGYQPPDTSNNIAHHIYKVNIPPSRIYPHSFTRNNC